MNPAPDTRFNVTRSMLMVAGVFFLVCAAVYNPWLMRAAVNFVRTSLHRPWTTMPESGAVKRMEMVYLAIGAVFTGTALLIGAVPSLDRFFRRGVVATVVLTFLAFFVPVTTLEAGLRPFTPRLGKDTALFVKDDDLGWRLRPSTTQRWGGVNVTVNAKGLRGPALPYDKPAGAVRILYLGDSVVFGYSVARWQDTFPWLIERALETGPDSLDVETVDAGVGGYSPWQELIWLREEGVRYHPDLIVLDFVLNDVTEKFTLVRYGGLEQSRQLRESYHSPFDALLSHSALATKVSKFARKWKAKRVLGSNPQLGAIKRETFDVDMMIHHPEKEHIQAAWRITLESVQGIFDTCRKSGIPLVVVIHPFTMQFDAPDELDGPQRRLAAYAAAHGVRTIDLLPPLHDYLDETNQFPSAIFLDRDHLNEEGHRVVARILADSLRTILDDGAR